MPYDDLIGNYKIVYKKSEDKVIKHPKMYSDYYVTPVKLIRDFLVAFTEDFPDVFKGKKILDPCAGGSKKDVMSYPVSLVPFITDESIIVSLDKRDDSRAKIIGNYFDLDFKNVYDIIISCPPSESINYFLKKAVDDVKEGGYVVFLMKLKFAQSNTTKEFWSSNPPYAIYTHSRTLSFSFGGNDDCDYAHIVIKKGYKDKHGLIRIG